MTHSNEHSKGSLSLKHPPPLCAVLAGMHALVCVLSHACSHMRILLIRVLQCALLCALICVLSFLCFIYVLFHVWSQMCALVCVLSCVCAHMWALTCVPSPVWLQLCATLCALELLRLSCGYAVVCMHSSFCSDMCARIFLLSHECSEMNPFIFCALPLFAPLCALLCSLKCLFSISLCSSVCALICVLSYVSSLSLEFSHVCSHFAFIWLLLCVYPHQGTDLATWIRPRSRSSRAGLSIPGNASRGQGGFFSTVQTPKRKARLGGKLGCEPEHHSLSVHPHYEHRH